MKKPNEWLKNSPGSNRYSSLCHNINGDEETSFITLKPGWHHVWGSSLQDPLVPVSHHLWHPIKAKKDYISHWFKRSSGLTQRLYHTIDKEKSEFWALWVKSVGGCRLIRLILLRIIVLSEVEKQLPTSSISKASPSADHRCVKNYNSFRVS